MKSFASAFVGLCALIGFAQPSFSAPPVQSQDFLVKLVNARAAVAFASQFNALGAGGQNGGQNRAELLGEDSAWIRVQLSGPQAKTWTLARLRANKQVVEAQPNYPVHLLNDYKVTDPATRARALAAIAANGENNKNGGFPFPGGGGAMPADNPDIPTVGSGGGGADPLLSKQWGMLDMGVKNAWAKGRGKGVVVAVIDTGVDYTHEDLVDNLWRNAGEMGRDSAGKDKSSNGVDDDSNGFVDDVIGWDFASNDNKPFDLATDPIQMILGGGNPGHGTHCAGNVAARADNGKGVAGAAPDAQIMALRFLNEKGQGDTASAVKAINYAVAMGAKVLSNSWGSEGEDPAEGDQNKALRDAIQAAQDKGVLFIAAAGNGHSGVGYDNDSDAKPGYPASYNNENIVSVAAIDSGDKLGAFSNWGLKTVHIAAPGVAVFSTTVGSKYSDTVIDMFGIHATWDGTSMATPHVAGAAAMYWSAHPSATWKDVKAALLASAKPVPTLQGKMVSGGKLNAEALMNQ